MGSQTGNGTRDRSERDSVWGSPFDGRRQDPATPTIKISQSPISPALSSGSWRRPAPEPPSDQASATGDDGFTTVTNATPQRSTSRLNPTRKQAHSAVSPRQQRAPLSAAAASRSNVYTGRNKPLSNHMKQSCLPIGERDANLVLAEQNKGRKLAKEVYKTGMIIRAALHEPFLSGATDVADKSRTESKFGAICTKYRKMIVVALYQDHYVALPLYTHNGNGLQGKAKPDEFVSIKDHRSREPFTKLSTHKALVTENINTDIHPFSPKCTAHLTYPVSRKYDLPVTPEGNLDKPSIKSLIQLYNDFAPRPSKV